MTDKQLMGLTIKDICRLGEMLNLGSVLQLHQKPEKEEPAADTSEEAQDEHAKA